jgi:hypothetical protein
MRPHALFLWRRSLAGPAGGGEPVFRFYNTTTGAHFYTTSLADRDQLQGTMPQFAYEGIAFHVYSADGAPVPAIAVPSSDGFRFLRQASFGPTPATLSRVKAIGVPAYLEEQFALPASGYPDSRYNYLSLDETAGCSFSASRQSAA